MKTKPETSQGVAKERINKACRKLGSEMGKDWADNPQTGEYVLVSKLREWCNEPLDPTKPGVIQASNRAGTLNAWNLCLYAEANSVTLPMIKDGE